jgi:hypothetical protein
VRGASQGAGYAAPGGSPAFTSHPGPALAKIAPALAATDPDRAERTVRSLTDDWSKAPALAEIAQTMAATDPDRAAGLLGDAERTAHTITDERGKMRALTKIAQCWLGRG